MAGVVPLIPRFQFFNPSTGNPLAFGSVTVYLAGTTTPVDTFQNEDLDVLNTNPVNLNGAGECTFWVDPANSYKFLLTDGPDGTGATVSGWPIDDIPGASVDSGLRAALAASGGSALVGFLPAGAGAVATTLQAKARLRIDGADYGVVSDGSDIGSKLAGLISAVAVAGGGDIFLDDGTFVTTAAQAITANGVRLIGKGAGFFNPSTGIEPQTIIKYTGAAGADVLTVAPVSGASNHKIFGVGVIGIGIDGNSLAARGLVIKSVNNSTFDVAATGCTSVQIEVNTVASLVDARDPQMNDWRYMRAYATGSQNGILFSTDSLGANTSMNVFGYLYASHLDGYGIKIGNSDNNTFQQIVCARQVGGTGVGVILGAADGVSALAARSNLIERCSPGAGGVTAQGTTTAAVPSTNNVILYLDKENAAPDPTIETGATLAWGSNRRVLPNAGIWKVSIADTAAQARTELDNMGTSSMRVHNTSNNHARLTDGTNEWSVALDASGNLRFNRVAGTGHVLVNNDLKIVGFAGFGGATPITAPTVTGSRGGNAALASLLTGLANYGLIINSTSA